MLDWAFAFPSISPFSCFVDLSILVLKPRGLPRVVMFRNLSYWAPGR